MTAASEASAVASRQERLLTEAEQELLVRRAAAVDRYKRALLVASNALQTSRMLENLEVVVKKMRADQSADATVLEQELAKARIIFQKAIADYDETSILAAESQVEQLTLQYDCLYLEGEETRKREYLENRKKQAQIVKWTASPSSRFLSLLKGDLQGVEEVTEEERRSCVSKCAWGFAVLGMLVAISFLVVEYWSAQANPAIVTTLQRNDDLEVPIVYGCTSNPQIPTFENLPNEEFRGSALWGLRSYTNLDTNETLLYPETKLLTEETFMGRSEYCKDAMQYLSLDNIVRAIDRDSDPGTKCYSCLKIGAKVPFLLNRQAARRRADSPVTLEFAISRDIEFCFNPFEGLNPRIKNTLRDTMTTHGRKLVDRGVLQLVNTDSTDYAFKYGFDAYSRQYPNDSKAQATAEANVLCNLYLFSGVFFPVKPGTAIGYRFDADKDLDAWQQVGPASNFLSVRRGISRLDSALLATREDVFAEIKGINDENKFAASEGYVSLYTVNSADERPNPYRDHAATLRESHRDSLLFTRSVDNGEARHTCRYQPGARKIFDVEGRFRRYNVSLGFDTFDTEIMTRRPTTSTAEFLTDVFEYAGLFTGICAYSVLVGPARMYLKRGRPGS